MGNTGKWGYHKNLTNKSGIHAHKMDGFFLFSWVVLWFTPSKSFQGRAAPEFLQLLNPLQVLKVVGGERKLFQEGTDLGGHGKSL